MRTKTKRRQKRFYDLNLIVVIFFLACFGLVMIYSSSYYTAELNLNDGAYYFKRQGMIMAAGFVLMLLISRIDYHKYCKLTLLAYLLSIIMMILVNFTPLGIERNGKKRWLGLTSSLSFQPTEFVKIAIILLLAVAISVYYKKIDKLKTWILLGIAVGIPFLLVAMNNLSSGIIIAGIAFVMMFVASRKKGVFLTAVLGIAAVAVFAYFCGDVLVDWGILQDYQLARIHVWKDPSAYSTDGGYQILQGLYAIGSGGLFGKGLGSSIQKLGFVPEAQNDMIFSIICEELGLFGALCVIFLFLFLLWRLMVIANNAPDILGSMICVGIMAHIGLQVILNIAVVTNSIPNTGITLPFISYGGTSVLFLMIEMGMALGVSNRISLEEED